MSEAMLLSYAPVHGALPKPTAHTAPAAIALPPPHLGGGTVLMTALAKRKSVRAFAQTPLSLQQLSELLWAADGINRPETGGHTAPSAHGLNEVDIYVGRTQPDGLSGLCRHGAPGSGVRGQSRTRGPDAAIAARDVLRRCSGCDLAERIAVLRFGRAGVRGTWVAQPQAVGRGPVTQ